MTRLLSVPFMCLAVVLLFPNSPMLSSSEAQSVPATEPTSLVVLWTSGDPEVAHRVALMYTHAAKTAGWFEEVRLIVWGPSQRLLVGDKDLKAKLAAMRKDGIIVEACIKCAESYGLVEDLRELGLPVKPMGRPLTDYLKDPGHRVITF